MWQYVRDTELDMACLGCQVENVRTLFMEITRASQKGQQVASEVSKKSCQSGAHSFQSEQVREEYVLVNCVLKLHDVPLVET